MKINKEYELLIFIGLNIFKLTDNTQNIEYLIRYISQNILLFVSIAEQNVRLSLKKLLNSNCKDCNKNNAKIDCFKILLVFVLFFLINQNL